MRKTGRFFFAEMSIRFFARSEKSLVNHRNLAVSLACTAKADVVPHFSSAVPVAAVKVQPIDQGVRFSNPVMQQMSCNLLLSGEYSVTAIIYHNVCYCLCKAAGFGHAFIPSGGYCCTAVRYSAR